MTQLLQVLLSGTTLGCIYAVVALGFTLTIVAANIVNFAYGEWVTYGAFFAATFATTLHYPLLLALLLTVLCTAAIGFVFQWLVFAPLEGKHFLSVVLATVGVGMAMQSAATLIWGPYPRAVRPFFGSNSFNVGGVAVLPQNLIIIGLTFSFIMALQVMLTRSPLGLRVQATAQDPEASRLMGIRLRRMRTMTACVSAALAGLAAFLVAPVQVVTVTLGFSLMLKGFAATILGGWGSLKGAIVGGLTVGIVESLTATYVSTYYKDAISFAIIIAVLLVRPRGIFGEKIAVKL
jgi:branched-chain amino acid transport system permease protein